METFVAIRGYENKYTINQSGVIKTFYNKNGKMDYELKQYIDKDGYRYVKLYADGKCRNKQVHRLVAETFIPNINNKPVVNHKDCNRLNNNVSNLEWCTVKENVNHSVNLGHYKGYNFKKVAQCDIYGNYIKLWPSISDASKGLKISVSNICNCCKKNRSNAGGYTWMYVEVG